MRKYRRSRWVLLCFGETDINQTASFTSFFITNSAVASAREALLASIIRLASVD